MYEDGFVHMLPRSGFKFIMVAPFWMRMMFKVVCLRRLAWRIWGWLYV